MIGIARCDLIEKAWNMRGWLLSLPSVSLQTCYKNGSVNTNWPGLSRKFRTPSSHWLRGYPRNPFPVLRLPLEQG